MGKDRKSTRTKGNLQASDSSRAAELLGVNAPTAFIGFSQFVPSTTSGSTESVEYNSLSHESALILKRLTKKDATTKVKAADELSERLVTEPEEATSLLPYWPKTYTRLSMDPDRRVRLAIQVVHLKLVNLSRKQLASIMPELIGPWLKSMFDPAPDVCKLATQAFETVLTEAKRPAALKRYLEDIIQYADEMLFLKTPETLNDARHFTPEEMSASYSLVTSGVILSLVFVLQTVPDQIALDQVHDRILSKDAFWTKLGAKESRIKQASLKFLQFLLNDHIDALAKYLPSVRTHFLKPFFVHPDPDRQTAALLWETLVMLSKSSPDLWDHSVTPKILNQMCHFLKNACFGLGHAAYPCLVLLLVHITPSFFESQGTSHLTILNSLWSGLYSNQFDQSLMTVFIQTFVECFIICTQRYFGEQLSSTDDEKECEQYLDLVTNFLEAYLNPSALYNNYRRFAYSHKLIDPLLSMLTVTIAKDKVKEMVQLKLIECVYRSDGDFIMERILALSTMLKKFNDAEVNKDVLKLIYGETLSRIDDAINSGTTLLQLPYLVAELKGELISYGSDPIKIFALLCSSDIFDLREESISFVCVHLLKTANEHQVNMVWHAISVKISELNLESRALILTQLLKSWCLIPQAVKEKIEPKFFDDTYQRILELNPLTESSISYISQYLKDMKSEKAIDQIFHFISERTTLSEKVTDFDEQMDSWNLLGYLSEHNQNLFDQSSVDLVLKLIIVVSSPLIKQQSSDLYNIAMDVLVRITKLFDAAAFQKLFELHVSCFIKPIEDAHCVERSLILYELSKAAQYDVKLDNFIGNKSLWSHEKNNFASVSPLLSLNNDLFVTETSSSKTIAPESFMHFTNLITNLIGFYERLDNTSFEKLISNHDDKIWFTIQCVYGIAIVLIDLAYNFSTEEETKNRTIFRLSSAVQKTFDGDSDLIVDKVLKATGNAVTPAEKTDSCIIAFDLAKEAEKSSASATALTYYLSFLFQKLKYDTLSMLVLKHLSSEVQVSIGSAIICKALVLSKSGQLDYIPRMIDCLLEKPTTSISAKYLGVRELLKNDCLQISPELCSSVVFLVKESSEIVSDYGRQLLHLLFQRTCEPSSDLVDAMSEMELSFDPSDCVTSLHFYSEIMQRTSLTNDDALAQLRLKIEDKASLVVDLFLSQSFASKIKPSKLLETCNNIVCEAVRVTPLHHFRAGVAFDALLHLLVNDKVTIKKTAYFTSEQLVRENIQAFLKALEAVGDALDGDQTVNQMVLPEALKQIVSSSSKDEIGFALGWCLVLDHLKTSNGRLKARLIIEIQQDLDLYQLILILAKELGLGSPQPFDLTKWDLTDYKLETLNSEQPTSVRLFYAHVLLRLYTEIPSLVRAWYMDCKDRPLVRQLEIYTTNQLSSLVSSSECRSLSNLDSSVLGESLKIRVLQSSSIGSEIRVVYTLDECPLEFLIRLSPLFPLRMASVESVNRVGVSEEKWRYWLMTCNSFISYQHGNLAEAIVTWKDNLERHIAGMEDCPICYAVIGTLDRSFPTKPCRTCKHKFHSACLTKWFKSSKDTTCPLCRSTF